MTTAEKIKKYRKEKGLTQEALGELVGVQKSAIAKYENGRVVNIKRSVLQKLGEALGVSPAELLDDPAPETATIAAHHEKEDFTEAELAEIEEFKKYVLSKRKNND